MKIEITPRQFLGLYGDNEHVRHFGEQAALYILEQIEESQEESGEIGDWTAWFMDAGEYKNLSDVPEDRRDDVITIGNGFDGNSYLLLN